RSGLKVQGKRRKAFLPLSQVSVSLSFSPLSIRSPIRGSQQRYREIGKHLSQSKHRPSLSPHGSYGLARKKIAVAVGCAVLRGQREPGVFPDPRTQGQCARVRDKARQEAGRNYQEGTLLVLSREGAHVPVFRTTSLQR